jgi:hypothetical protein
MKEKDMEPGGDLKKKDLKQTPDYVPPKIITYTSEQILEEIGPAQACSPFSCISPG